MNFQEWFYTFKLYDSENQPNARFIKSDLRMAYEAGQKDGQAALREAVERSAQMTKDAAWKVSCDAADHAEGSGNNQAEDTADEIGANITSIDIAAIVSAVMEHH